ncbi:hypothetical protein [Streptacidiphilus sp. MAP5-52]|uniref:hypothetical protein n=1 Tax=Streptacidiphilus sp. MAP5-52 TaxID=3156267 RepID=UPI00351700A4
MNVYESNGKWHWNCADCGSVQRVIMGEAVARRWAEAHPRWCYALKAKKSA